MSEGIKNSTRSFALLGRVADAVTDQLVMDGAVRLVLPIPSRAGPGDPSEVAVIARDARR